MQGCVLDQFVFGFATKEAYDRVFEKLLDSQDGFFGAFADDAAYGTTQV